MTQGELFELPPRERKSLVFKTIKYPLWSENKAKLIARYLKLFVMVTKHGAYIDGFAAPQSEDYKDNWSAKLVLQSKPQLLRDFWLCELDAGGFQHINDMVAAEPKVRGRRIATMQGDFNALIDGILSSGRIKDKTAAFCLLDQRTFECDWATVRKLATHKKDPAANKIELFYFLGSGWLDRALAAISVGKQRVEAWWGKDDWQSLKTIKGKARADLFCKRFADEFGYKFVFAWPIYERGKTGKVMYHMIHCTDHEEAPKLMSRAYRTATRATDDEPTQLEMAW